MKKNLFIVAALATLLSAVSCQKEFGAVAEGEGNVTFTLQTPGVDTKAIADGTNVDIVYYEIYRNEEDHKNSLTGEPLVTGNVPMQGKEATLTLNLLQGQEYVGLFWAQVDGNDYYNVENLRNVQVSYPNSENEKTYANDEARAAFCQVYEFDTKEVRSETVTLVRPFAQINLGTSLESLNMDYEIKLEESSMTVYGVSNSFNVAAMTAGTQTTNVVFSSYAVPYPAETLSANDETWAYAGMNYVLVPGDDAATVKVDYSIKTDVGTLTRSIESVPVRENHRTNILGNLLTQETAIEIIVDANFEANEYVVEDGANYISISSAEELVEVAEQIAAGNEEYNNIMLGGDIDLADLVMTRSAVASNWTPIGTEEKPFTGIFDGNGFTIKNLALVESEAKEGKAFIGFFGYAKDATIKNVTFENVYINIPCLDIDHSQGHIGAVAGSLEGTSTIENVTVKGDIQIYATQDANGASRVAVVAGGNSYGNVTMKEVHVIANDGSYLKANNNVGALAGQLQGKSVFENCSSNIDVTGTKFFAGGIIGLAAGEQTFTNCHTTGDITITAGRLGKAHDHYRVGGIAGGWADGAKNVCTLTNCSYTGELSGTNADGSVAEAFDYAGYVGRGYTLNNCKGSKVIIDGVEYVQAFNTAAEAGVYTVNGYYEIATVADLKRLATMVNAGQPFEGISVKLVADIDLNNEEWTPIGSAYADHGFMGNFDGNGYTIKNLKMTKLTPDADGYVYAGLFGVTEGTETQENYIKNLVIENVTIETAGHIAAAAIAYPYYTTVENVTVKGNVNIKGGDYTSGVLAYTRRCVNAKNIAIVGNQGSSIEGGITVGGVISDIQMNGGLTANYSNFSASGLTIKATKSVGGICGIIGRQALNGATVKNVALVCADPRTGIVAGAKDGIVTIENVSYENVTGASRVIGAIWKEGYYVGQIVEIEDAKAIIYTIENGVKAVSVDELNLKGKNWNDAMAWAETLGGHLATIDELDEIHSVRSALNDVLEADNAENALFEEDDYIAEGKYAMYLSSSEATGNDPQGQAYFANRVHLKYFNLNGYWDYPLSTFSTINKSAPLRDNYFARAVFAL